MITPDTAAPKEPPALPRPKPDPARHAPQLVALAADVGHALTTCHTLPEMLQGCADALVQHLPAVAARLWTPQTQNAWTLQASAGQPKSLASELLHQIAQQRQPVFALNGDAACAGCPLWVEDRLVGIAAVWTPAPLSPVAKQAAQSAADQIAVGIERTLSAQALQASEARYRAAFAHAAVGVTLADLQDRCLEANAAFCTLTGYSESELLGKDFPTLTHTEDRAESLRLMDCLRSGELAHIVMEKRYVRKDGSTVWVQNSVALVRDADHRAHATIALSEDISRRKAAEAERAEAALRQRAFARDVLASVTDGRLILCDGMDDLPAPLPSAAPSVLLSPSGGLSELRHAAADAARRAGHAEERVGDLIIAVSEAGMNAIVHAQTGTADVGAGENGTVQVRVVDCGTGITLENLPKATLERGFSTASTLGHGLKMMLATVDRLFLLTGADGTTVVVEQEPVPVREPT